MPKRMKYPKLDFRALNTGGVLTTRYPAGESRAQIRRLTEVKAKRGGQR